MFGCDRASSIKAAVAASSANRSPVTVHDAQYGLHVRVCVTGALGVMIRVNNPLHSASTSTTGTAASTATYTTASTASTATSITSSITSSTSITTSITGTAPSATVTSATTITNVKGAHTQPSPQGL